MTLELDAYTTQGRLRATLLHEGRLVDALEAGLPLRVRSARLAPLAGARLEEAAEATLDPDDLLVTVATADLVVPGHQAWHPLRLRVGPWAVEGSLPTMPGFDPARALARPTGTFVLLGEVVVRQADAPDEASLDRYPYAFVNRYGVEAVEADLELGFFFPGAASVVRRAGVA